MENTKLEMDTVKQPSSLNDLLIQYLEQLSEKDRKSYEIAKSHLGMSFQLEKSVDFIKWKKQLNSTK
jgi:hypothetical protein